MRSRSATSSLWSVAAKGRGAGEGMPDSTGRPSFFHLAEPPSSTATRSWPNARKVHHTRAEAISPRPP